jgi:hypothetical protein
VPLKLPNKQLRLFMTTFQIVGYCLTAFGLGYAGGSIQRISRRAIETLS